MLSTHTRRLCAVLVTAALLLPSAAETAAIQRVVRLRNVFISHIKNRATIVDLPFTVDHVKDSINSISSGGKDGDLHVAGRPGPFVALPLVAEVVNARLVPGVVKRMNDLEGSPKKLNISGAWRLWFEHPPNEVLIQGGTVPKPANTNPDHVFELHPITDIDGQGAAGSFALIKEYTAFTAKRAFGVYEKLEFRAKRNTAYTTISSTKAGFNYTQFAAVLAGMPMHMNDATFVLVDVQDENGSSVVAKPIRLVIADNTDVKKALDQINPKTGTKLTVLGIPRVNLDILMDAAVQSPGETVVVKGAYEIIVVGVK